MAATFFMEHNFSPRWTSPRQQRPEAPRVARDSDEGHRRFSLDSFARVLHAFNAHHEEESGIHGESKVHPRFDLIEGPADFKIYGNVPGITSKGLHVDVNDHLFTITISGKFEVPQEIAALQSREGTVPVSHQDITSDPDVKVEEVKSAPAETKEETAPEVSGAATASSETPAKTEEEAGKVEAQDESKGKEPKQELKQEGPKIKYHVHERKMGPFKRAFQFPVDAVDMESVKARCKDGLLMLTVPKNEAPIERKGRKLDVV